MPPPSSLCVGVKDDTNSFFELGPQTANWAVLTRPDDRARFAAWSRRTHRYWPNEVRLWNRRCGQRRDRVAGRKERDQNLESRIEKRRGLI